MDRVSTAKHHFLELELLINYSWAVDWLSQRIGRAFWSQAKLIEVFSIMYLLLIDYLLAID